GTLPPQRSRTSQPSTPSSPASTASASPSRAWKSGSIDWWRGSGSRVWRSSAGIRRSGIGCGRWWRGDAGLWRRCGG
ncbi:hypothetical protein LTR29_018140, partial [Friedmanniomyces endolithicus]